MMCSDRGDGFRKGSTHPTGSFFTIDSPMASRLFVGRKDGISVVSSIPRGDEAALQLMGDNFYLPMISKSVKSALEEVVSLREEVSTLNERLAIGTDPILFVEGETDQSILRLAFSKLFGDVRCPFSIEAAGGTQKMKALHAEGPALNIAASGRRIFVLTDNDFDGRDVAPRNSVGKWTSIKNGAVWWVLKPTDEYVTQMRRVCFDANMHFFCIEDCFSVDVRREASIDIVDICSSYKYNAPRNYSIKVDHARLVKLAESDAVFKYSVFGPEHNAKKQFVEWLENRPAAEFEYFRPFFKELIAMLALVK